MKNFSPQQKKIAFSAILVTFFISYYVYSSFFYMKAVSNEIDQLSPLGNEKVTLSLMTETDKNFTLELNISGTTSTAHNLNELTSYYEETSLRYVCQSPELEAKFEEGYHIHVDIKYHDEPDKTFYQAHFTEKNCSTIKSFSG